ncbi:hypothetical protein GEMRC1_010336 [Eukaryota sp. GEM-RC1]
MKVLEEKLSLGGNFKLYKIENLLVANQELERSLMEKEDLFSSNVVPSIRKLVHARDELNHIVVELTHRNHSLVESQKRDSHTIRDLRTANNQFECRSRNDLRSQSLMIPSECQTIPINEAISSLPFSSITSNSILSSFVSLLPELDTSDSVFQVLNGICHYLYYYSNNSNNFEFSETFDKMVVSPSIS